MTEAPPVWWLSFANDEGFRGACLVRADGMLSAVTEASRLGCNPGGEVSGTAMPADDPGMEKELDRWGVGVLITKEQLAEANDYVNMDTGEPLKPKPRGPK